MQTKLPKAGCAPCCSFPTPPPVLVGTLRSLADPRRRPCARPPRCSSTRHSAYVRPLLLSRFPFLLPRRSTAEHAPGAADSGQGKNGRRRYGGVGVWARAEAACAARPWALLAGPVRFGGGGSKCGWVRRLDLKEDFFCFGDH
jgi:hypothetical protein